MDADKEQKLFVQLDKIERGIYGDPDNEQEGLIAKVNRHDKLLLIPAFIMKHPKLAIPAFLIVVFAAFEVGHRGIGWVISLIK